MNAEWSTVKALGLGYSWTDVSTMGGDELRALPAAALAHLLADALADGSEQGDICAMRAGYYLDIARFGETAAAAIELARDGARDGNFSTASHLEAIEHVLATSGAPRGSRLSTYELAQFARATRCTPVYDTCDLMTLVRKAESSRGILPADPWQPKPNL